MRGVREATTFTEVLNSACATFVLASLSEARWAGPWSMLFFVLDGEPVLSLYYAVVSSAFLEFSNVFNFVSHGGSDRNFN